jgi:hypothetical protein
VLSISLFILLLPSPSLERLFSILYLCSWHSIVCLLKVVAFLWTREVGMEMYETEKRQLKRRINLS